MFGSGSTALIDNLGERSPVARRSSMPEKPWGPGLTKAECIHGLPLSGLGADLSWSAGKKLFESAPNSAGARGRTKIEHLAGIPFHGGGADISRAGGRRHMSPSGSMSPRLKSEHLAGMPLAGGGADIAYAGGRRMFECRSQSAACLRSASEPPQRGVGTNEGCSNVTVQDLHLRDSMGFCGRNKVPLRPDSRRVTWCADGSQSPRGRRGASPSASASPRKRGGSASASTSPRKGARRAPQGASAGQQAGSDTRGRAMLRQNSMPARLDAVALDLMTRLAGSEQLAAFGSRPKSAHEEASSAAGATKGSSNAFGMDDGCSDGYTTMSTCNMPGASEFVGQQSLDSVLKMSVNAARALQTVAETTPAESKMRGALDAVFKDKMDTAWAAMCMKLDLPLNPAQGGSPRKAKRHSVCGSPVSGSAAGANARCRGQGQAQNAAMHHLYEEAMQMVMKGDKHGGGKDDGLLSEPSTMLPSGHATTPPETSPGSAVLQDSPFGGTGYWDFDSSVGMSRMSSFTQEPMASTPHTPVIPRTPVMVMDPLPLMALAPVSPTRLPVGAAPPVVASGLSPTRRVVVVQSTGASPTSPKPTLAGGFAGNVSYGSTWQAGQAQWTAPIAVVQGPVVAGTLVAGPTSVFRAAAPGAGAGYR